MGHNNMLSDGDSTTDNINSVEIVDCQQGKKQVVLGIADSKYSIPTDINEFDREIEEMFLNSD